MKKRLLTLMSVFAVSALVAACSGGNTCSCESGSNSQAASSEVQGSEGGANKLYIYLHNRRRLG